MNFSIAARRRAPLFIFLLLVAAFGESAAQAGPMYVYLIIDPPNTAFFGIPAAGGFSGTSNRSGPGTWHLFAVDDVAGSFGIQAYAVTLAPGPGGVITGISHRSPKTAWDDDPSFGNGSGPFDAGFTSLRTGTDINPIIASQGFNNSPQIAGYGRATSNFQAEIPTAQSYAVTVNGQWGNYCDSCATNALFIAEGSYTVAPPVISAATVNYYANAQLTVIATASNYLFSNPFPACIPEPTTLTLTGLALYSGFALVRRRRA